MFVGVRMVDRPQGQIRRVLKETGRVLDYWGLYWQVRLRPLASAVVVVVVVGIVGDINVMGTCGPVIAIIGISVVIAKVIIMITVNM